MYCFEILWDVDLYFFLDDATCCTLQEKENFYCIKPHISALS